MPDIKPIGKSTVHHICSGQVILDLTTAVKELVENSLDAGATAVEVKLKEYGLEQIEVIDNGCGVEEENFQSLTLKHHTSKLRDFSDLVSVATFGFRGEALSSLCALCNVTICTRHKTSDVGCKLEFDHDGIIKKKTKLARQIGTTVTLTNLFATLPVRQKEFKRNIKKEYTKLVNVMSAYCLISTKARMSCSNQTSKGQRNVVLSTQPTGKIEDNIQSLFTSKQLKTITKFVQVEPTQEICDEFGLKYEDTSRAYVEYHVSGHVTSQGGGGRSSPDRQFIFVNSRPVDLPKLTKSINQIYRQRLNRHQYPFVLLNVEMERSKVDVNVTPDKRKVFLQHEKILLAIVKTSLFNLYKLDDRQVATIQLSTPKQLGIFGTPTTATSPTATTKKRKISLDGGDGSFFEDSFNDSLNSNDSSFVEEKKASKPPSAVTGGFSMLSSFRMGSKKPKQCCDVGQRRLDSFNITTSSSSTGVKKLNQEQAASSRQELQLVTPLRQVPASLSEKDQRLLVHSGSDHSASAELASVSRQEKVNPQEEEELAKKDDAVGVRAAEVVERKKPKSIWTLYGNTQASQEQAEKSGQSSALDSVAGLKLFARSSEATSSGRSCKNDEKKSSDSSLAEKRLMSDSQVEINEELDRKIEEQKDESNSKAMTVSYDDVESGNNENHSGAVKKVEFSMKRVGELVARRKQLQGEEDEKSPQGGGSSFRAKIAPSQNCRAEEELSRNLNKASFDRMSIIGQFNLGFIVARLDDDLFIIDQHATDEIYNFEKLQESTEVHQQHLVVPKKLNLSAPEQMTLKQHIRVFERNGFGFVYRIEEDKEVVYLSDVPHSGDHSLGSEDVDELIFMLTDSSPFVQSSSSSSTNFPRPSRLRKIFASRACRKSVMIGTALSKHEMKRLLRHMSEINHPWNCPHGRPTIRHLVDLSKIKRHKSS